MSGDAQVVKFSHGRWWHIVGSRRDMWGHPNETVCGLVVGTRDMRRAMATIPNLEICARCRGGVSDGD